MIRAIFQHQGVKCEHVIINNKYSKAFKATPNHIQIKNIVCFGKKKTYFLFLNFKIGEFFATMLKILLFFPLELNCLDLELDPRGAHMTLKMGSKEECVMMQAQNIRVCKMPRCPSKQG